MSVGAYRRLIESILRTHRARLSILVLRQAPRCIVP